MTDQRHRDPDASSAREFELRLAEWGVAIDRARRPAGEVDTGVKALTERLVTGSTVTKVEAIRQFAYYGELAVMPLCAALRDRAPDVHTAAAETLGEVGDERAIRPLADALQRCFDGGSAVRNVLLGIGAVFGMVVLLLLALVTTIMTTGGTALWEWGKVVAELWRSRRRRTERIRILTEALARISERTGSPELRRVLPDLRIVALDVLSQGRQTRATSRAAVARIEALTSELRDLPLPATGEPLRTPTLPYPARPSETAVPRVEARRL
jgi:hypothetical protein